MYKAQPRKHRYRHQFH